MEGEDDVAGREGNCFTFTFNSGNPSTCILISKNSHKSHRCTCGILHSGAMFLISSLDPY